MLDNFDDSQLRTEKTPSFSPEVMLKLRLVFEQICADNRISRKALEQRGTLALAIIRAAAKGQELPELKNAGLAAIGIRLSEHCAYDQAFVGQAI